MAGDLEQLVARALQEDLGPGDVTTDLVLPLESSALASIEARAEGVISGHRAGRTAFRALDPHLKYEIRAEDGEGVSPGDVVARIEGMGRAILSAERTALNFLQLLSGIATATARFVRALDGTGVRLLDTRKTVPGLRDLSKDAVRHGGGQNHRWGLHDMVLVKENHTIAAGGLEECLRRATGGRDRLPVEVEVRSLGELEGVLSARVDRVMLDNFTPEQVAESVRLLETLCDSTHPRPEVEVSGGITIENVREYAVPGVDFISVGSITHSAPVLDLTLLFSADHDLPRGAP